jgi:hypothetical protein
MPTLQAGAKVFRAIFLISTIIAALRGQAAPAGVTVQVSPKAQGIVINTNQQFTATVTGNTDTRVTWIVNGVQGGNATYGTITIAGLYSAPAVIPSNNVVTIKATSTADPAQSDSATVTIQPAGARPAAMPILVSPPVLQPSGGKLPSTALLSISIAGCDDSSAVDLSSGGYSIVMSGVGLTFATPSLSKCFMTSTLNVEPTAGPGTFSVVLLDGKKPVGKTDFGILDANASPIPTGMAPQVDATFGVVGQKICEDTFGKRVAQSLYCVSVRIGNNSGHPLQIAGIGFAKKLDNFPGTPTVSLANNTYASTRAVLQRESVLSGRNILYNTLDASGLLMASFTPFFVNPVPKSHFATGASILSGVFLQAFNIIAPDRVVGQLNNLDDQSFRDNQVIPNNSQIVTMVFVEKSAVTEALNDLLVQVPKKLDTRTTGLLDSEKSALTEYSKTLTNDSAQTVKNSRRPRFNKGSFSPFLVKLALGKVIIVGDEIQYLQRVQVQGSGSPPASPSGVSVSISPTAATVAVGAQQTFTASVTGNTNTTVNWTVNGIAGGNASVGTITSAGVYTAPASLPTPNPVTVKATSAADSTQFASATVTVITNPITVAISPTSAGVATGASQSFTATIAGSSNQAVTWSVNGTVGGNSTVGTITTAGVYTAPSSVPSGTVTVTATSVAAPSQFASATVTIH